MTIGERIKSWKIEETRRRGVKLAEIGAPKIVVESCMKAVEELKSGDIAKHIGGDREVLGEELVTIEECFGNGGKSYYRINGNINFFPYAAYGMYIKRA